MPLRNTIVLSLGIAWALCTAAVAATPTPAKPTPANPTAATPMQKVDLRESAMLKLPLAPGQIDLQLKALGATAGRPWRKEQKAACLAAWVATAGL